MTQTAEVGSVREKQKAIDCYYSSINKLRNHFIDIGEPLDISRLNKKEKEFLRYKFACIENYPDCEGIASFIDLDSIKWCQVKCRYSYDKAISKR